MADYYALISEGIASLDKKTIEARREYYGRARAILADYCRKADPPLSETFIANERRTLEDAISKVEANVMRSQWTPSIPKGLQTQSDHTEDEIRSASLEASSAQPVAKEQRGRRIAFWGFLIVAAFWIGDLVYEPPTSSGWYDWLRLGGLLFFPIMATLSYLIMRENWSLDEEERAYIVFTPIILVGAVLASVALHFAFG